MSPAVVIGVVVLAGAVSAGCGSEPAAAAKAGPVKADPGTPAEVTRAMADLQASERWSSPSCRWLTSGAWVLAYPEETALLQAAATFGYLDLTQVGEGHRHAKPEPAWSVKLTDAGITETKACTGASKEESFGLPVARRKFISGAHVATEPYGRIVYSVEFTWEMTAVGARVQDVLTEQQAVPQGTHRTKVYMRQLSRPDRTHFYDVLNVEYKSERLR